MREALLADGFAGQFQALAARHRPARFTPARSRDWRARYGIGDHDWWSCMSPRLVRAKAAGYIDRGLKQMAVPHRA